MMKRWLFDVFEWLGRHEFMVLLAENCRIPAIVMAVGMITGLAFVLVRPLLQRIAAPADCTWP